MRAGTVELPISKLRQSAPPSDEWLRERAEVLGVEDGAGVLHDEHAAVGIEQATRHNDAQGAVVDNEGEVKPPPFDLGVAGGREREERLHDVDPALVRLVLPSGELSDVLAVGIVEDQESWRS